jgi:hypothetical protein
MWIRACVEKIGKNMIFATDFTLCDHSTEEARNICFHKPKNIFLKEGNTITIDYEKEKIIQNLPIMIVGINELKIGSKTPDIDFLLDL